MLPVIRGIVKDTIAATYKKLDPNRRANSFELFGYDFLIDESWGIWLLEVNTNPCLEFASPYLHRLIPTLIENTLKLTVDVLFPEPVLNKKRPQSQVQPDNCFENRFELIFNEIVDGPKIEEYLGVNAEILNLEHSDILDSSDEEFSLEDTFNTRNNL